MLVKVDGTLFLKKECQPEKSALRGNAFQQIFYLDMQQLNPIPRLVSKIWHTDSNNAANDDSFRPRIGDDGALCTIQSNHLVL